MLPLLFGNERDTAAGTRINNQSSNHNTNLPSFDESKALGKIAMTRSWPFIESTVTVGFPSDTNATNRWPIGYPNKDKNIENFAAEKSLP